MNRASDDSFSSSLHDLHSVRISGVLIFLQQCEWLRAANDVEKIASFCETE